jgi:Zn-dependent peptidase ImmA (M78 family)
LAIFFFPSPPDEKDIKAEFRLLPAPERDQLAADTLLAARQARSMQESLRELTGDQNPAERKIFRDIEASRIADLHALVSRLRDFLGVTLQEQHSWGSVREALKNWRKVIELNGIYVFKRSLRQREISGFSLTDPEFPVILINNSTSDSRQIFTLFHELAHILFAAGGVTTIDQSYMDLLPPPERQIEIACNRLAGAFLVPDDDFLSRTVGYAGTENEIEVLASQYSVSREVILRKFLDLGRVKKAEYEEKTRAWNEEFEKRAKGSGGNYYATQASYLGSGFLKVAFSSYYEGRCSLQELAGHLGLKARNVERLESFVTRGA